MATELEDGQSPSINRMVRLAKSRPACIKCKGNGSTTVLLVGTLLPRWQCSVCGNTWRQEPLVKVEYVCPENYAID